MFLNQWPNLVDIESKRFFLNSQRLPCKIPRITEIRACNFLYTKIDIFNIIYLSFPLSLILGIDLKIHWYSLYLTLQCHVHIHITNFNWILLYTSVQKCLKIKNNSSIFLIFASFNEYFHHKNFIKSESKKIKNCFNNIGYVHLILNHVDRHSDIPFEYTLL